MEVIVIIVGIGKWNEYTKPCIESIIEYEPNSRIILVDNGTKYKEVTTGYGLVVGFLPKVVSYSEAINNGLSLINPHFDFDWLIVINNDVLCTGPFIDQLKEMDEDSLYGNRLHLTHPRFDFGSPWVDGWFYAIPKKVLDTVGKWDENFKTAAFEDADYSYRAFKEGFTIRQSELSFIHLEKSLRKLDENFKGNRLFNLNYLIEKHNFKRK